MSVIRIVKDAIIIEIHTFERHSRFSIESRHAHASSLKELKT